MMVLVDLLWLFDVVFVASCSSYQIVRWYVGSSGALSPHHHHHHHHINHSSIQCNTHTHIYNLYNMYTYIDCILTHNNCTNRNDHRYLAVSWGRSWCSVLSLRFPSAQQRDGHPRNRWGAKDFGSGGATRPQARWKSGFWPRKLNA